MYHYKANLAKRFLASLLDYLIYIGFFIFYVSAYGHYTSPNEKVVEGVRALPLYGFWIVYFIGAESLFSCTLGHYAFHLKVLTKDRNKSDIISASARHLMDIFDFFFLGIPALILISKTEKHQRLGDLLAGTIVVDTTDQDQYAEERLK